MVVTPSTCFCLIESGMSGQVRQVRQVRTGAAGE